MDHALSHCLAAISESQSEPTLLEIALAAQAGTPVAGLARAVGRRGAQGLDRRQRQAVTHGDGPLLVVAGPGTGKKGGARSPDGKRSAVAAVRAVWPKGGNWARFRFFYVFSVSKQIGRYVGM